MTVKELIEELQEFDEDLQIWFNFQTNVCSVELSENYNGDNVVVLW